MACDDDEKKLHSLLNTPSTWQSLTLPNAVSFIHSSCPLDLKTVADILPFLNRVRAANDQLWASFYLEILLKRVLCSCWHSTQFAHRVCLGGMPLTDRPERNTYLGPRNVGRMRDRRDFESYCVKFWTRQKDFSFFLLVFVDKAFLPLLLNS